MVNADMEFFDTLSEFDNMKIENLSIDAHALKAIISMFRIDNVTDRNTGILQAYMKDMATREGILKGVGSRNGKNISISLDLEKENNSLIIRINDESTGKLVTSIGIKVEDGKYVVTSNTIKNTINELFNNTDETKIIEQIATLSDNEITLLESIGLDLSKYKLSEIESDTKPIIQAQDEDIEVFNYGTIPEVNTKAEEVIDFGATISTSTPVNNSAPRIINISNKNKNGFVESSKYTATNGDNIHITGKIKNGEMNGGAKHMVQMVDSCINSNIINMSAFSALNEALIKMEILKDYHLRDKKLLQD